jgi:PKD repeat protein
MRRRLLKVVLGFFLGAIGCGDGSLDPLPLNVTIEASRTTAAPGNVIEFIVTAQGGTLVGVTIDYDDDSSDQFGTGGARTARVTFSHAFSTAGVYQVRATVVDAVAGSLATGVQITIQ